MIQINSAKESNLPENGAVGWSTTLHQFFFGKLNPGTAKFVFRLGALFAVIALILVVLHDQVWQYGRHPDLWIAKSFNLDGEHNVPTWFNSIAWFGVALTAFSAYIIEGKLRAGKSRIWWLVIGTAFLIASCDDVAQIHENVGLFLDYKLSHSDLRYHLQQAAEDSPWLMFYIIPISTFGAISAAFMWNRFKAFPLFIAFFVLGGVCYATALTCEWYQGQPEWRCCEIARMVHIATSPFYDFTVVLEETMEVLGSTCLMMGFAGYCLEKGSYHIKALAQSRFQPTEASPDD